MPWRMHLLTLHASPDSQACSPWRGKIVAFRNNAKRRFAPSRRPRINVGALYAEAVEQLRATDPNARLPAENPFTLDQLLKDETNAFLGRFPPPAAPAPA
jgi:hypothetical protein